MNFVGAASFWILLLNSVSRVVANAQHHTERNHTMKTTTIAILLSLAAAGAFAQSSVSTNAATATRTVLQPGGGQTDALAASRQTMQQAEAAYNTALAAAAPGLTNLDAQISQTRQTLMDLQTQRQRMVRTAERSIADVANARDTARDAYMQSARTQMAARQAAIAAQHAAATSGN